MHTKTTQQGTIGGQTGTDGDKTSIPGGNIHSTGIACAESDAFAGKSGDIITGDSDRCSDK